MKEMGVSYIVKDNTLVNTNTNNTYPNTGEKTFCQSQLNTKIFKLETNLYI